MKPIASLLRPLMRFNEQALQWLHSPSTTRTVKTKKKCIKGILQIAHVRPLLRYLSFEEEHTEPCGNLFNH